MTRTHFHSFDALRFFSFLLVFLLHLPDSSNRFVDFFLKSGGIGVSFFFVLSGFLITFILLFEKESSPTLSFKNFLARRILRIWPLFYAMVAFAYLSPYILEYLNLPYESIGYKPHLVTSLLFGENYRMMLTGTFPDGAPLSVMWSLCIEEHFYILWGLSIFFIQAKKVPLLIIVSILLANATRQIYSYLGIWDNDLLSHLDYFAFGAIPAYIYIHKPVWLKHIGKIPTQWKYAFLTTTIAVSFIVPNVNAIWLVLLSPTLFGILFATTILFTLGVNPIHIKDSWWFSKLGVYTYGLYLYHTIVIILLVKIFDRMSLSNWYLLAISSLLTSILISIASYHLFEKQFLKLKRYFYQQPNRTTVTSQQNNAIFVPTSSTQIPDNTF